MRDGGKGRVEQTQKAVGKEMKERFVWPWGFEPSSCSCSSKKMIQVEELVSHLENVGCKHKRKVVRTHEISVGLRSCK